MNQDDGPRNIGRTKGVDSARRALQILLQFSEGRPELTLENVIENHGLSVPSAYRYISLLRELDLVEERSKGVFVLSPQVIRLARAAEQTLDYGDDAQPFLDRLSRETNETALYLRRVNESAVCLAIAESDQPISISFSIGHLMPLHGGAAAKILLADYARREQYLARTELSPAARRRLEEELDTVRRTGYAESSGEVDRGVWASAAAVHVRGTLVGAVTVAAPAFRLSEQHRSDIAESVRHAAADLEVALERGRVAG